LSLHVFSSSLIDPQSETDVDAPRLAAFARRGQVRTKSKKRDESRALLPSP